MNDSSAQKMLARLRDLLPPDQPGELARALVAIPSENPPGAEGEVVEYCAGLLKEWGLSPRLLPSPSGRANLEAELRWGRGARRLVFNGHLDVVPPGDPARWSHAPYGGQVEEGRLYGRGASDMKGGAAAMLWAARLLQLAEVDLGDASLVLHLVSDEESGGSQGTGHLAASGLCQAQGAVVGEPTDLQVVCAQKGVVWFEVTIVGRPAHASIPHRGINAIEKAGLLMPLLHELAQGPEHPLLGSPTINLGTIQGGDKINVVPERCTMQIDRRLLPGEDPGEIEQRLKALLQRFAAQEGVEASCRRLMDASPAHIPQESEIINLAQGALRQVLDRELPPKGSAGFTDARFYIGQGTPAILLGPGLKEQCHVNDEYVELERMRQAALVYALLAMDFFK